MRRAIVALAGAAFAFATGLLRGAEPAATPPKVYALVAAVGTQFTAVHAVMATGSHLPPYRPAKVEAANDVLNRLVLRNLDAEIARLEPGAKRVLMTVALPRAPASASASREGAAIERVTAELAKLPQRQDWHRIVVVTPAYQALERDGLGGRLQGLGLFIQPLCSSNPVSCELGFHPPTGPMAETPEGELRPANYFIAPFSYLRVWILDPATLAVLEQREVFDHRKLASPAADLLLDLRDSANRTFVAQRIVDVVERSVHDAVMQTELAGEVDVRRVREVTPPAQ